MNWGNISHDARTDLYFFHSSSVNTLMYIEDLLLNYIVPYMPFIGADSLFMQENVYPHVAAQWML